MPTNTRKRRAEKRAAAHRKTIRARRAAKSAPKSAAKPKSVGTLQRKSVLNDAALLERAIAHSGKTAKDFAADELHCHDRTIRKYLSGRRLPALAREKCEQILAGPPGTPAADVG